MKIDHEKRNMLTEHECNYKRYNPAIIDGFNALHPPLRSKLCMVVFNIIMETKRYHKPGARYYSEEENRRIYSNKYVSLEGILDRCYPVKYGVEGKDVKQDVSNLMKKLQELDDMNIFYIWRYGFPYTYMFLLERDIGLWTYFNPNGCVTPKSLKKVVRSSNGIIDTMVKLEKSRKRAVSLQDVERSFLTDLIGHLVSKMDKTVAKKLPKWDQKQPIADYLSELRNSLAELEKYDGLIHHETFAQRLPKHLRDKIIYIEDETKENKMDLAQLSKDLVPTNENVVTEKKSRRKRVQTANGEIILANKVPFKSLDPFANCNQFMKFYREVIRMYNNNANFYSVDSERREATEILDLLIHNGKNGDRDFLRSWIRYYIGSNLYGNNVYKPDRTALINFRKTFKDYEGKYFEV